MQEQEPDFLYIDGRKHVANAAYMLPKDLEEMNRLDFQHFMLRHAMRGNFIAPVSAPHNILDVACGTGRWVYEVATVFPKANVFGIDLVDPRNNPNMLSFPENCIFTQGDVTKRLPFVDRTFEFVHQRLLLLGIPAQEWPTLLRELIRVSRPGGWIELVEINMTGQRLGPELTRLARWTHEMAQIRGIDPMIGERLEMSMQAAGLVNIKSSTLAVPTGNWGGRLGKMMLKDYVSVVRAARPLILAHTHIRAEEYDRIVAAGLQECEQYRSYTNFYITYGQISR